MGTHVGMRVYRTARKIVIELPLSTLRVALHGSPLNSDCYGNPAYRVTDKDMFGDAIVEALEREEDDGTTPLHRLFDAAILDAIEDGCEGVALVSARGAKGGE